MTFLLPFAAGNFVYIAASGLVPKVGKDHGLPRDLGHFTSFVTGLGLLCALALLSGG